MSQNFSHLSQEDQEYLKQLWRSVGPGIGVGEALITFSRDLQHRRDKLSENEASQQEIDQTTQELQRIDDISRTLYDEPVTDIASQLQQEEADPAAALRGGDRQGLTQALSRVENLGGQDAQNGWIEPVDEQAIDSDEVGAAVYSLRQIVHLSDPEPGDTYAQSPMGQMVLHYWQGASHKLVRQALEEVDPGRVKSNKNLIRHTAQTMDELELEEYINNLREEATELTADWLEATRQGETLSDGERISVLSAIHQFNMAVELATRRANQAVEQAYLEARSRGDQPTAVFEDLIAQVADELDRDPAVIREIAEGVVPADPSVSLTLRRFRSARRQLERQAREQQHAPSPGQDAPGRSDSAGRGL